MAAYCSILPFTMKEMMNQWLKGQSKRSLASLNVQLCLLIGLTDYRIEIDLSFSTFYQVPIAIAARHISRNAGLLLAVLCSWPGFLQRQPLGTKAAFCFLFGILAFGYALSCDILDKIKERFRQKSYFLFCPDY